MAKKAAAKAPPTPDASALVDLPRNDEADDPNDLNESVNDDMGPVVTDTVFTPDVMTFTPFIDFLIEICDYPLDSTMVKCIYQQGWSKLDHVIMIPFDEMQDIHTVKSDGKFEAKPMVIHIRLLKCFILYYRKECSELADALTEYQVRQWDTYAFSDYCRSTQCQIDMLSYGRNLGNSVALSGSNNHNSGNTGKVQHAVLDPAEVALQDWRRSAKRDKSHYEDMKDDKFFTSWNRGLVATARTHHTSLVLRDDYVPRNQSEVQVFLEMQAFMYSVFEVHLKTDKGKSLVSQYEETYDAQSIYRELAKHALSSTAAQLSGDTLLQYITSTRYPGTWRGSSYGFVLHWKEQVMKYERLELEPFPPKQKLRMLQNTVGDVTELAYVKQIGDQDIARGLPSLGYESYLELLMSACSTYDKKLSAPTKVKRAVYASHVTGIDDEFPEEDNNSYGEDVFHVDTDIREVMMGNSNFKRLDKSRSGSKFLPREEWAKLTQEQKDMLIAKRREERMKEVARVPPHRQANQSEAVDSINLDDLID
jgi:hypothetical protein